jgi:hypothetical protein
LRREASGNGGLIVVGSAAVMVHSESITVLWRGFDCRPFMQIAITSRPWADFIYAPEAIEQYRLAAGYVDRILKSEKPAARALRWGTVGKLPDGKLEFVIVGALADDEV